MPKRGNYFSVGMVILSGPVAVDEKRFVAAVRNSMEEKGK